MLLWCWEGWCFHGPGCQDSQGKAWHGVEQTAPALDIRNLCGNGVG